MMTKKVFFPLGLSFIFLFCYLSELHAAGPEAQRASRYKGISEECHDILHDDDKKDEVATERCLAEYYQATTIIVTATRTNAELKGVSAPAAMVSKEEIVRMNPDSVAELLRDVPGIEISDAGQAGQKRIRIRGEDARRVLLLIDGQEFTDQREVGTPMLIAPEMIERIEIIKGPGSVLYGSKAIGGVINIITKKGGYHPFQSSASTLYNSATNGFQHYGSAYGTSDGFDYRVSYATADHNDRNVPHGPDLENTSFDYEEFSLYLGKRTGSHNIAFAFDNYNSGSDVFVEEEVRTSPPFQDFQINVPTRDREKFSFFYDWEDVSESLVKVHLDAYYQKSERVFDTFFITEFDIGFPLRNETSISTPSELENTGVTLQSDWNLLDSHYTVLGYQMINDDLDQDRARSVISNGVARPTENIHDEASRISHSVFLQDEWEAVKDVEVTAGVRAYWVKAELDESNREGLTLDSNSDRHAVGSVGVSYLGIEDTTFWTRWAQGYLYPTLIQTGTGAFAGPDFVNPNSDLEPETSDAFDLGMRFDDGDFAVDIGSFVNLAEDFIDFVPCEGASVACLEPQVRNDRVYVNADRAKTFGAEGVVSYAYESLMPYASLAWLRRKVTRGDFSTYDSGLPDLMSRVGVRYEREFDSALNGWVDLFVRMSSDSDEREDTEESEHNSGWTTLNASAGLEFGKKRETKLVLELRNLTDKEYVPATENLVAAGASAIVKLAIDL